MGGFLGLGFSIFASIFAKEGARELRVLPYREPNTALLPQILYFPVVLVSLA